MRRHFASRTAAFAVTIVSLGLFAGAAVAADPVGSTTSASTAAAVTPAATSATTTTSSTTPTTTTPTTTTTTPTTTTPTTPTPTPPKPPAPKPVKAKATLFLDDSFTVQHDSVTVPGRVVEVRGVVRPFVAGQSVAVVAYLGKKRLKTDHLRVKPSANHRQGLFTEKLTSPGTGIVRVTVTHARTKTMLGFQTRRAYVALNTSVGFDARGQMVDLIQQRLAALHIYVPQTGVYDTQTGLAMDAYNRLLRQGFGQIPDAHTITNLLNGTGSFQVRYPGDGTHVEGNLGSQLLAEIDGSKVLQIYPISSGKPSTPTVLGRFQVYYRVPGYLPDGMYFSSFFFRGYAIHGFDPAPDFPASHGCMRLPIIDAISVFDWVKMGDWVDVYQ
jgi:hypothetical protein